ncbi:MAG: CaiB/BaiF CoA transferase family protein [Alphaproteobacteria bacterium]
MGPLEGMRVLDLSHVMAGPTCALMLADMGADVVKVEKLPGGDDVRRQVPPRVGDEAASFLMMNRNKRGIALDLKKEGGRRVLERLVAGADVLVENFSPGTMERLGLGYERLAAINPALVYCSVTGFGRTGPDARRRGFDLVAQATSGIMSFTGEGPGRPPVKCGAPLTDITAGILAAMGVVAAYANRLRTGRGQMVDTSLFEAGIVHTYWQSAIAFATGVAPGAMGSAHPLSAPYQAFEASDGWLVVGGANQANWLRLVDALDAPGLRDDPRFAENRDRIVNVAALEAALAPLFRQRMVADWLARLEAAGVPCAPVNDVLQMHAHPQAIARGMVTEVDHATLGRVRTIGAPVKFSRTPGGVRRGAPLLGQHTREVLREAGFAEAEIESFFDEGAAAEP